MEPDLEPDLEPELEPEPELERDSVNMKPRPSKQHGLCIVCKIAWQTHRSGKCFVCRKGISARSIRHTMVKGTNRKVVEL